MICRFCLAVLLVAFAVPSLSAAKDRRVAIDANGNLEALIAKHAAVNGVPADLIRRVIKRESGGNPRVVSKGNYGLMQIKLATARGLGYRGTAEGLLDADTNMTYAVKYLAGAYKVAGGNADRAVRYYAAGYYYAAKHRGYTVNSAAESAGHNKPAQSGKTGAETVSTEAAEEEAVHAPEESVSASSFSLDHSSYH